MAMTMFTRRQMMALLVQNPQFRTSAQVVVVPVTVLDRKGKRVAGLRAEDFELTDNGRVQTFQLEDMNAPLSLVLAVETAETSRAALEKIRKTAPLFEPLLAGHDGEVGLIAYSGDVRVLAELSGDSSDFEKGLKRLQPDGGAGRLLDAVGEGVRLLKERPTERRRVMLVIGESKDLGSQLKLDKVVGLAQQANVTVYPLTYSRTATPFTSKTPLTGNQMGIDILGGLREVARLGQANAAAELARFTGGWTNSFVQLKGLEAALGRIADELHLQYLLTYEAKGVTPGEYRRLEVRVKEHPSYTLRHRPGYWIDVEPGGL